MYVPFCPPWFLDIYAIADLSLFLFSFSVVVCCYFIISFQCWCKFPIVFPLCSNPISIFSVMSFLIFISSFPSSAFHQPPKKIWDYTPGDCSILTREDRKVIVSHVCCTTASSVYICVYVVFFSFFSCSIAWVLCACEWFSFLIGLELISLTIK